LALGATASFFPKGGIVILNLGHALVLPAGFDGARTVGLQGDDVLAPTFAIVEKLSGQGQHLRVVLAGLMVHHDHFRVMDTDRQSVVAGVEDDRGPDAAVRPDPGRFAKHGPELPGQGTRELDHDFPPLFLVGPGDE
jgi:hypothetical protein